LKYLLDTNIISELIKPIPNRSVVSFIDNLDEDDIFISVITIGEIQFGIQKLPDSKKKEKLHSWLHNDLLRRFHHKIIGIDTETMLLWGELSQQLKAKGMPMPIMDLLIATTCLHGGYLLITRNEKDFAHLEIKVINPFRKENR